MGRSPANAILQAMEDGPDTALTLQDYVDSAGGLACHPANVMAFAEVESSGAGFIDGYPKMLFEPHRFCKLTKGVFSAPIRPSAIRCGARPYPRSMEDRYQQLLEAVGCDVYAGLRRGVLRQVSDHGREP
jgi:hypothetical protein